jgi:hypothetical protein
MIPDQNERNIVNALLPLIQAGLLQPRTTVTWKRRGGQVLTATVEADGSLTTADGKTHRTPSGAARHFTGKPIDGWHAWALSDGRRLSDLREAIGGSSNV